MQERQTPTDIGEARLKNIDRQITLLRGEIAELELEAQRIQVGMKPQDLSGVLSPRPIDIFWTPQTDFNQTRAEQANQQSDAKAMHVSSNLRKPPYEHLLQ